MREAASRGARLVALPENFAYLRREGTRYPCAQGPDGEIVRALARWAREYELWLVGGHPARSDRRRHARPQHDAGLLARRRAGRPLPEDPPLRRRRSARTGATCTGSRVIARRAIRSSSARRPGAGSGSRSVTTCASPSSTARWSDRGARWIVVPSAFTRETGKDHWEVLLRARAIENQCFVLAPAQCGHHAPDRASHGRSLVIDPWGLVIAQAGDEPTVLVAECREDRIDRVREAVPALRHRSLR